MSPLLGWDIGGAHLKLAEIASDGRVVCTEQYATPLWLGLDSLKERLESVASRYADSNAIHAVTMTGELVDFFPGRDEGVRSLIDLFISVFPGSHTLVYAGSEGLLGAHEVHGVLHKVASANWHATANYVATRYRDCILVDLGSTTTDLVPIQGGIIANAGYSDRQRLQHRELVYTGMIRTPVMAVVREVEINGKRQGVAAEYFATMSDVYRILGLLNESHDLYPAADNGEKTLAGSKRRLAHMLGADYGEELGDDELASAARFIADEQLNQVGTAFEHIRNRPGSASSPDLIAAGIGRELLRPLAEELNCKYRDLGCILGNQGENQGLANTAPAIAVAQLARLGHELQIN